MIKNLCSNIPIHVCAGVFVWLQRMNRGGQRGDKRFQRQKITPSPDGRKSCFKGWLLPIYFHATARQRKWQSGCGAPEHIKVIEKLEVTICHNDKTRSARRSNEGDQIMCGGKLKKEKKKDITHMTEHTQRNFHVSDP